MSRKKSYPNALEWVQLAAYEDAYSAPALSAVHVTNNGKRIEASNKYLIHAVEFAKPILPNGFYRLNGEFDQFEKLAKDTAYPTLEKYDFEQSIAYVSLRVDAEEDFVAYLRAAETYTRTRSSDSSYMSVEFQGQCYNPVLMNTAIAGLLLRIHRYGVAAEALKLQVSQPGALKMQRKFSTETRMAAVMCGVVRLRPAFAQVFLLDQFFKPASPAQ